MNLVYIPYINGPRGSIPTEYAGSGYEGMLPSAWRERQETDFLNQFGATFLSAQAAAVRAERNHAHYGTYGCRPRYVAALHNVKLERQELWMDYLEAAVCRELDDAAKAVMKPYSDAVAAAKTALKNAPADRKADAVLALQRAETALDSDCLLVAALPEFFWRDINDSQKHVEDPDGEGFIPGYGRPFYPAAVERLVNGQGVAVGGDVPTTFQELTQKYANLVVFAGTVWWKKIVDASGCSHAAACRSDQLPTGTVETACTVALPRCEKMFNTLPVFYHGSCICLWNKQWISHIDGLGSRYDMAEKYTNRSFALSAYSADPTPAHTVGKILGLPAGNSLAATPEVAISHGGRTITFGMDICLDFLQGYDPAAKKPIAGKSMSSCMIPVPDIQVLIAGGMPLDPHGIHAKSCVLRCDALESSPGIYAEAYSITPSSPRYWTNGAPGAKPFQVLTVPLPGLAASSSAPVTP